jgi:hypothetical protein
MIRTNTHADPDGQWLNFIFFLPKKRLSVSSGY